MWSPAAQLLLQLCWALFDSLLRQQEVTPSPYTFQQWGWRLPSFSTSSHIHTSGLAGLLARDALPTPTAREHLINTPHVKWSQWIFLCVCIHRIKIQKKKKTKKNRTCPCLWDSHFTYVALSFPLLVSFSYKIDAVKKKMRKNNPSSISVPHQHYQETLFSSVDSIYWLSSHAFCLSYLAFVSFLFSSPHGGSCFLCSSHHSHQKKKKKGYRLDFFLKCIRMEKINRPLLHLDSGKEGPAMSCN